MPKIKLETIIAKYQDGNAESALGIVVELVDDKINPIDAIRAAAKEFAKTDAGKAAIELEGGRFNYGDLVDKVPQYMCKKHGFAIISTFVTEYVVEHDDNLTEN